MRRVSTLILVGLFVILGVQSTLAQSGDVFVLEIGEPVTPVMANYFERGLETAVSSNARALLIILDTPGGDLGTTLDIVQLFRTAPLPIIVYVGPEGAQAASAGSIITAAAHAAAMAPETIIGAASPINSDGSDIGETAYRKAVEDLKATMRSLTDRRGEDAVALAEAMIEDARAVTANEALAAGLIDVIETDEEAVLMALDGLTVMVDNELVQLDIADASLQRVPLNFIEQLLFILATPLLIGVLFAIGTQALIFEVTHPGGWAAGVTGVLLLALALIGAGQLPVNFFGFGLILLAFGLLIGEALTPTSGPLAITGAAVLLAGLLVLFNSPGTPEFARISIVGAISITILSAGFFLFLVGKLIEIRRKRPQTGVEGMVAALGVARADFQWIEPQSIYFGTVLLKGEIWQAESDTIIEKGSKVIVQAVDKFRLKVKKDSDDEI